MSGHFSGDVSVSRAWLIGFSAILLSACSGCALIPLATLGTVLGVASTAASTAPEVYELGKLDVALRADDGKCRRAVRLAAADLQLHIVSDGPGSGCEHGWKFELRDDRKGKIEITVERRTAMLCLCRVDVGIFGSEPTAHLVMQMIKSHLPAAATGPSHEEY
jgi:hypothetical protein